MLVGVGQTILNAVSDTPLYSCESGGCGPVAFACDHMALTNAEVAGGVLLTC